MSRSPDQMKNKLKTLIESQEVPPTKEELLKKIQELQKKESEIDKEIHYYQSLGVREEDSDEVVEAMIEHNKLQDDIQTIFKILTRLNKPTIEELYAKFNIKNEKY